MPNLCGVNQKLFAEVLQQVKKTGDDRRASVTPDRAVPEVSSQWFLFSNVSLDLYLYVDGAHVL